MKILNALNLVKGYHEGQLDKQGVPYWHHLVRVMVRLGPGASNEERIGALLHDTIEDHKATDIQLLTERFPTISVAMSVNLAKGGKENYGDYLERLCNLKGDFGDSVRRIKLADNYDNSCPSRPVVETLIKRYKKARESLRKVIPEEQARTVFCGDVPIKFMEPFYNETFNGEMSTLNWELLFKK